MKELILAFGLAIRAKRMARAETARFAEWARTMEAAARAGSESDSGSAAS